MHSALERLYYGVYREKNLIRNNMERISKTSLSQRERIDSSKRKTAMEINRKGPILKSFMQENVRNFTSKLKPNYNIALKSSDVSKKKNENDAIRSLYKEIDTLSLSDSISDEEEWEINNSSKTTKQLNGNGNQKSDFIKRNYEFQLKLAFNFNQIEALETKKLNYKARNSNDEYSKNTNSNILDEKSKKTEQNIFHRNSLTMANSRPLLIKRVINDKKL